MTCVVSSRVTRQAPCFMRATCSSCLLSNFKAPFPIRFTGDGVGVACGGCAAASTLCRGRSASTSSISLASECAERAASGCCCKSAGTAAFMRSSQCCCCRCILERGEREAEATRLAADNVGFIKGKKALRKRAMTCCVGRRRLQRRQQMRPAARHVLNDVERIPAEIFNQTLLARVKGRTRAAEKQKRSF